MLWFSASYLHANFCFFPIKSIFYQNIINKFYSCFYMGKFTFMLAPIEDMTSNAFRSSCHKYGADLTFTEVVRFGSLAKNNKTTWQRIFLKDNTPTVVQLIGHKDIFLKKFLGMFEKQLGFDGFNLNLGCPAPNFVNHGVGCAMIKRVSKTKKLVNIIKEKGFPVSVKIRLGLNKYEKEKKAYLNLIDAVDADFFVVHARHGQQTYAEPADFSVYEECVKTGKTIIANGDIKTKEQIDFLKGVGVRGAMIGRTAVNDPTIFARLKGIKHISKEEMIAEFNNLSEKYGEAF